MSGVFGSSSGQGATNSTTVQQLDPQIKNAYLNNLTRATSVADTLGVQQFAPRTGDFLTGEAVIRNTAANGPGYGTLGNAVNTANSAANFGANDIDQYVNPYAGYVASNYLNDLGRQNSMAIDKVRGDAISKGAFGGSRLGLAEAETNRNYADVAGKTLSGIYSNAYDAGTNTALNANAQKLNAANTLSSLGQTQQTMATNAGQNLMNLGLGQQQYIQQQLDAYRNLPIEKQQIINTALGLTPAGGAGTTSTGTSSTQGKGLLGFL